MYELIIYERKGKEPKAKANLKDIHDLDRIKIEHPQLKGYYYELINIRLSKVVRCGRFR